jgi:hypothetical protein
MYSYASIAGRSHCEACSERQNAHLTSGSALRLNSHLDWIRDQTGSALKPDQLCHQSISFCDHRRNGRLGDVNRSRACVNLASSSV